LFCTRKEIVAIFTLRLFSSFLVSLPLWHLQLRLQTSFLYRKIGEIAIANQAPKYAIELNALMVWTNWVNKTGIRFYKKTVIR
jgi:hypothetical protein